MINFRYHIVSLMAVFLALSVGIVVGVTLRGPVDQGLVSSADQDRNQVTALRAELDRRNALDDYRDSYAARVGKEVALSALEGQTVAVVQMPDAPTGVVNAVSQAVTDAGGTLTHTVKISADVFDPTKTAALTKALSGYDTELGLTDTMSSGTRFGLALGRVVLGREQVDQDVTAVQVGKALTGAGLVTVSGKSIQVAELAIVVTAESSDPATATDLLNAHVAMDIALKKDAVGVVLAGPNSDSIEATDVLTARNDATGDLSTVDVADLTSGVTTTILAGKEQLLGRSGDYGALTKADAPLPALPVR